MTAGSADPTCPIQNLDLEKAINALPQIDEIPHCFLQTLHRGTFLCPVQNTNGGGCLNLPATKPQNAIPFSEHGKPFLALFTSPDQMVLFPPSSSSGHVHVSLSEAVQLARSCSFLGLVLNPGSSRCMKISHEAFEKILTISPTTHPAPAADRPEELEITQGEEMIVSTPDPAPPELFLSDLARALQSIPQIRDAYLFELAWKNTTGELVLGIMAEPDLPPEVLEKALDSLSSAAREAAKGFDHFDVMTLDDPAMIEVIQSAVPSLLTGGNMH